jgi:tetratricopeptide (TPR) repeat protein
MRCLRVVLMAATLVLAAAPGSAQFVDQIRNEYSMRIRAADNPDATSRDLVLAAQAARFFRKWDESRGYLDAARATAENDADLNAILTETLWLNLATGGGVDATKRIFRADVEARGDNFPPAVIGGWIYWWPELLVGGEYDALIQRLSGDAADPGYRCDCYATKAWMHRVAGRPDEARVYWGLLNDAERDIPDLSSSFDEADWRGRRARNLARAGRADEARAELESAMAVDLSAFESVSIRRRRAQTYAELGDVDKAVEDLEFLLSVPSLVTYYTLRDRLTWAPIRDRPAFQALLAKHLPEG